MTSTKAVQRAQHEVPTRQVHHPRLGSINFQVLGNRIETYKALTDGDTLTMHPVMKPTRKPKVTPTTPRLSRRREYAFQRQRIVKSSEP